jgi:hypothetical protein
MADPEQPAADLQLRADPVTHPHLMIATASVKPSAATNPARSTRRGVFISARPNRAKRRLPNPASGSTQPSQAKVTQPRLRLHPTERSEGYPTPPQAPPNRAKRRLPNPASGSTQPSEAKVTQPRPWLHPTERSEGYPTQQSPCQADPRKPTPATESIARPNISRRNAEPGTNRRVRDGMGVPSPLSAKRRGFGAPIRADPCEPTPSSESIARPNISRRNAEPGTNRRVRDGMGVSSPLSAKRRGFGAPIRADPCEPTPSSESIARANTAADTRICCTSEYRSRHPNLLHDRIPQPTPESVARPNTAADTRIRCITE